MVTFSELSDIPTISGGSVSILWSVDWYDGPLSGIAEFNGKRYWFELFDYAGDTSIHVLIELTPAEIAYENEDHELFEKHVADRPREEWWLYYERKGYRPDRWMKYRERPIFAFVIW